MISREIELILLGTGTHCLKPPLELKEFWLQNKVSFEIMNSFSAYKTYNILLSEKRAAAVVERLVSAYGVSLSRLSAKGVGFLAPLTSNSSKTGRELNRRVEFVLTRTP